MSWKKEEKKAACGSQEETPCSFFFSSLVVPSALFLLTGFWCGRSWAKSFHFCFFVLYYCSDPDAVFCWRWTCLMLMDCPSVLSFQRDGGTGVVPPSQIQILTFKKWSEVFLHGYRQTLSSPRKKIKWTSQEFLDVHFHLKVFQKYIC